MRHTFITGAVILSLSAVLPRCQADYYLNTIPPDGVHGEVACMCARCSSLPFCATDVSDTATFSILGNEVDGCPQGYGVRAEKVFIFDSSFVKTQKIFCINPWALSGRLQAPAICPGAPSDFAHVGACDDVPVDCRDPDNQTVAYFKCNDHASPGAPTCQLSADTFMPTHEACGKSVASTKDKLASVCSDIRGSTVPSIPPASFCYANCFASTNCLFANGSTCAPDCFTSTLDPPGRPSAAYRLSADVNQSIADMTVVVTSVPDTGTPQTYPGSTHVGGEIVFDLSPDCRGPLPNNQQATCAQADITELLLDSRDSFKIAGKTVENLRLLLEQPATVQGVTIGDKTTLTIPPNTVFATSSDLESQGRVGTEVFTNGTPFILIIDWTNRVFALPKTKIQNQQKNAFLELTLGGAVANQPPRASAGDDQTVECTSPDGTEIKLSGSKTTDPDGQNDIASYRWDWSINSAAHSALGVDLTTHIPLGTFPFSLTVHDLHDAADIDSVLVTSQDKTPPVLTLGVPSPACLWPPNHKFVLYELGKDLPFTVTDKCDAAPKVEIAGVASSQAPDFAFGKSALCLESERTGSVGDRFYTISIRATDASMNTTTKQVIVRVPHDQANDCPNIDKARIVDISDARCTAN